MMEHIPFMGVEDEPRFHVIIDKWIKEKEVEEFQTFTNEPKLKRDRRHKKYARESKEADKIKEKMKQKNDENDLAKQIMKRNQERSGNFGSFIDMLMDKYANEDDDDDISVADLGKRASKRNKKTATGEKKKETPIKAGRVSKRNKK